MPSRSRVRRRLWWYSGSASAGGGPRELYSDSGVGSDANPVGGIYTQMTGAANGWRRFFNVLGGIAGSDNNAVWFGNTDRADTWIEAEISGSATNSIGLLLRASTSAFNSYLFQLFSGNTADIARWDNAGPTYNVLQRRSTGIGPFAPGDVMYFETVGNVLTAKLNGDASVVPSHDISGDGIQFATGRFGLYSYNAVGSISFVNITAGDFI